MARHGRVSEGGLYSNNEGRIVLLVGLATLLLVAVRASVAVSFYDDTHYVTMALRIANGAVPLADEMSLQSLGFLVPAAFVWLWTRVVGMTGLVLAYRLLYVALAAAVAAFVYRVLRRSLRPTIAGAAALLPFICPPFNLVAPSYNTLAMLGCGVAFAAGYASLLDGNRRMAALAGAGIAFASVSYPPLAIAMAALALTLLVLGRGRRLALPLVLGALAVAAVLLAWLVPLVHPDDVRRALAFATSNVAGFSSPLRKLGKDGKYLLLALTMPQAWPLVLLVGLASARQTPERIRALAFLGLPIAAALPGLLWLAEDTLRLTFGTTAPAWLLAFTGAALVPVWLWARRRQLPALRRLLLLALPASAAGFALVAYSTNASLARAVPVVGIVPLGIAVVAGWTSAMEDLSGGRGLRVGALTVLLSVLILLFAASLDDARPATLHASIEAGPYAGLHMSSIRYREMTGLSEAAGRYVAPADHVTFLGERTGYLLVGGRPYTNAVWLYPGPADYATLEYFKRHGGLPEVVFVDVRTWRKKHQPLYVGSRRPDPVLSAVLEEYRMVDSAADFDIFVRRDHLQ